MALIEARSLVKAYRMGGQVVQALDDVSLEHRRGRIRRHHGRLGFGQEHA